MFLNNGLYQNGSQRLISTKSVKLATTKETGPLVKNDYGFGWAIARTGTIPRRRLQDLHGVEPERGIVLVFLVQIGKHWGTERGKDVLPTFVKAAEAMVSGTSDAKVQTEGQASRTKFSRRDVTGRAAG